ncbi:hypothetical protein PUN28_010538 [Cardiocondyla obscurior]|uniref:Ribosomal protein L16 n=1 Tax=Cardiocondyla obscurior TaxID=286306 RepID=A0AAW2FHT9_9HYME
MCVLGKFGGIRGGRERRVEGELSFGRVGFPKYSLKTIVGINCLLKMHNKLIFIITFSLRGERKLKSKARGGPMGMKIAWRRGEVFVPPYKSQYPLVSAVVRERRATSARGKGRLALAAREREKGREDENGAAVANGI